MKQKKNKQYDIIKIAIIALIIFILIMIILIIVATSNIKGNEKKKAEEENVRVQEYENSINDFKKFASDYEKETILPRNIIELYSYKGSYKRTDLYKNVKIYLDYLDYLKKNVTISNSEEFYKQNITDITNITGKENLNDFKDLISKIQNKNVEINELQYAEIEKGSGKSENGYFKFIMNVYYGSKVEKLTLSIMWSENKSNSREVVYTIQ